MTTTSNALPLQRAVRQSGSREQAQGGWTIERATALLVLIADRSAPRAHVLLPAQFAPGTSTAAPPQARDHG